jgi:hypothetical protein
VQESSPLLPLPAGHAVGVVVQQLQQQMLRWPGPAVGILSYRENVSYSVTVSMQKKPMQGSTKTLSNFHSGGPGYPGIPGMHTRVPWHTDLDPMFLPASVGEFLL